MNACQTTPQADYTPGQGLPIGYPTGSGTDGLSAQVSSEFPASTEPNTSASTRAEASPIPTGHRVGHRMLALLDEHLSERDRDVLARVAEHRFLSTHQVQAFCFTDHVSAESAGRTTRRVLARLKRDGLVRPLNRRIGGVRSGSAATIWSLAPAGSRLVHGEDRRRRSGNPSDRFLTHSLAVADVHLVLRQHEQIEAIEAVSVEVEPASWRRYQGPAGEPRWLQPDLYAELTATDWIDRYLIEVDLGTESLPTLLGKCEQFELYRRSGVEQDRHGSFPIVLWLFMDQARARKLRSAIRRSTKLTDAMYRFATPQTLTQVLAGGTA